MSRARALAITALLLSCSHAAAARADDVRVATLLPFVEDALRLAPEGNFELVATVRRDLHTPVAEGVADLGNPHAPNLETLAEARATLVVGDRRIHGRLEPQLAALGADVLLIDTTSTQGALDALVEVGTRIDAGPKLQVAVTRAREKLAAARIGRPRTALALFGTPGRFFVVNERSWLGALLEEVGYENTAPAGEETMPGFVAVSDETLALLEPDLVVVVAHGDPRQIRADLDRRAAAGGAWASMADAELGVHVLDPRLFSTQPGLALPDAADVLVGLASPPAATGGSSP